MPLAILVALSVPLCLPPSSNSEQEDLGTECWPIRVFDEDEVTPLVGATVWATFELPTLSKRHDIHRHPLGTAVTDENGIARLSLEPLGQLHPAERGDVELSASIFKFGYAPAQYSDWTWPGRVFPEPTGQFGTPDAEDVTLFEGRVFAGRVVDQEQRPIAGASLTAGSWDPSAKDWSDQLENAGSSWFTDPLGRFVLDLEDRSEVTVYSFHPDVGRGSWTLTKAALQAAGAKALTLELTPPDSWAELELQQHGNGEPARAHIHCHCAQEAKLPTYYGFQRVTDPAGKLRLPVWSDVAWEVGFERSPKEDLGHWSGYEIEWANVRVSGGRPMELPGPNLMIKVEDRDGNAVRCREVTLQKLKRIDTGWIPDPRRQAWHTGAATLWKLVEPTNGRGAWFSTAIDPGRYYLRATTKGDTCEWAGEEIIDVEASDGQLDVKLVLTKRPGSRPSQD